MLTGLRCRDGHFCMAGVFRTDHNSVHIGCQQILIIFIIRDSEIVDDFLYAAVTLIGDADDFDSVQRKKRIQIRVGVAMCKANHSDF
ncbi:hypothetical protein D3C85_1318910 [compost metagenome]